MSRKISEIERRNRMIELLVGLVIGVVVVILAVIAWAVRKLGEIQAAIEAEAERADAGPW